MSVSFRRIGRWVWTVFSLLAFLVSSLLFYSSPSDWVALLAKNFNLQSREVIVLVWHWPFGHPFELTACGSRFNIHGCHLTAEKELFSKADAVLIHHREIATDCSNLPTFPRPPSQKWVWMNHESPSHTEEIACLENVFNLTLSYRQDADIHMPYGSIVMTEKRPTVIPFKKRLVCWFVSNWKPQHRRVWYYKELRNHIRIHTYGIPFGRKVTESDYRLIVSSCKFYLSFENSIHTDYITEKFYKALKLGSVPIVMGPSRQNYEKFIPGDAFIHVDDFESPLGLAKHLQHLDQNEHSYRGFFRWQKDHEVSLTGIPLQNACYTCDYIRRHPERRTVKQLCKWFWDDTELS
ncbi:4-galactosyl-N-acetylglucosaminide 3-alpha-L-fucosyltransferase 9-like [Osmerus mordax]|uniref:Fucosyltransferase n=1 Tax=Osmerus mordax TaxID=8014 RepID=C1BIT5_OSMMO|nr:Alpha-1,3-fucosyltransferase [Osmerus mordax]